MDIGVHWGVFKYLKKDTGANPFILITAIAFDVIVLGAFIWSKASSDILVVVVSIALMALIYMGEKWFLKQNREAVDE